MLEDYHDNLTLLVQEHQMSLDRAFDEGMSLLFVSFPDMQSLTWRQCTWENIDTGVEQFEVFTSIHDLKINRVEWAGLEMGIRRQTGKKVLTYFGSSSFWIPEWTFDWTPLGVSLRPIFEATYKFLDRFNDELFKQKFGDQVEVTIHRTGLIELTPHRRS